MNDRENEIGKLILCTAHDIKQYLRANLDIYNITIAQAETILYLKKHETEEINPKNIADFHGIKPSTVNGILKRLIEKGLIEITKGKNDARCKCVRLTDVGRCSHEMLQDGINKLERDFAADLLDEEKEELSAILKKIRNRLKTENED